MRIFIVLLVVATVVVVTKTAGSLPYVEGSSDVEDQGMSEAVRKTKKPMCVASGKHCKGGDCCPGLLCVLEEKGATPKCCPSGVISTNNVETCKKKNEFCDDNNAAYKRCVGEGFCLRPAPLAEKVCMIQGGNTPP